MVLAEHVQNAVSLNAVLINIARAVGPAIGGILIATVGVGTCFLVNGASFIAVIIAYLSMRVHELHSTAPVARAPGQLRAGLAYVRRTRELLIPLVMMAIVGTLTYEFQVVLPAFATDLGNGSAPCEFGWITAAMGVGAIIGGLFTAGQVGRLTLPAIGQLLSQLDKGAFIVHIPVGPIRRGTGGYIIIGSRTVGIIKRQSPPKRAVSVVFLQGITGGLTLFLMLNISQMRF